MDVIDLLCSSEDEGAERHRNASPVAPRVQPARKAKSVKMSPPLTPSDKIEDDTMEPPRPQRTPKAKAMRPTTASTTKVVSPVKPEPAEAPAAPLITPERAALLSEWKSIEDQLRCDICKQLLDTPVSLKCFHTFCSFCIRRYLEMSGNDYCPCCRVGATSTDIRLEPRLAQILAVLGKERGMCRKRLRAAIVFTTPVASRNETFNKQADLAEVFARPALGRKDPVGRTLLPLYKSLKDKQLVELVCVTDGLEVPPTTPRDEMVRLHKEFVFSLQAAYDAVRMGMYPNHPPTRQGIAAAWNAEYRIKQWGNGRVGGSKSMVAVMERRGMAENSESVASLTADANERMFANLREAIAKRKRQAVAEEEER